MNLQATSDRAFERGRRPIGIEHWWSGSSALRARVVVLMWSRSGGHSRRFHASASVTVRRRQHTRTSNEHRMVADARGRVPQASGEAVRLMGDDEGLRSQATRNCPSRGDLGWVRAKPLYRRDGGRCRGHHKRLRVLPLCRMLPGRSMS